MSSPWISEDYLPSRRKLIEFTEGYNIGGIPVDRPREAMAAICQGVFEELNYTSYVLAYNLAGDLDLGFYDQASSLAMFKIRDAQDKIAQLQESANLHRPSPGDAVRRDQLPEFLHLVFDHIQTMIAEEDRAGSADAISVETEEAHTHELGITPASVNFSRHSGLVVQGSLADYCLAHTYLELITNLEIAINLAIIEEDRRQPQDQAIDQTRLPRRDLGTSNFGGGYLR